MAGGSKPSSEETARHSLAARPVHAVPPPSHRPRSGIIAVMPVRFTWGFRRPDRHGADLGRHYAPPRKKAMGEAAVPLFSEWSAVTAYSTI